MEISLGKVANQWSCTVGVTTRNKHFFSKKIKRWIKNLPTNYYYFLKNFIKISRQSNLLHKLIALQKPKQNMLIHDFLKKIFIFLNS